MNPLRMMAIAMVLPLPLMAAKCNPEQRTVTVVKYVCPEIRSYSPAKQAEMAAQIKTVLPILKDKAPLVLDLIGDYRSLRRGIEACAAR